MADDATDALYRVSRTTGRATRVRSSTRQFGASITNPRGLAWDGVSLYMITSNALYTLNKSTGVATRFGSNTFPSSVTRPSGIAWDGQRLFMVDAATDALYVLDTSIKTTRGSAVRVGSLNIPRSSNPAGLSWPGAPDVLYMGNDRPDSLYKVDRRTGSAVRIKGLGSITSITGLERVVTKMYAVDDGTDALYTLPGISLSAPTRSEPAPSFAPNQGDLYYNGSNFANAVMVWENPVWKNTNDCETIITNCSTYEHDIRIQKSWVTPGLSPFARFCSSWTDLPEPYDDCPTAGLLDNKVELSFGTYKANSIVSNRYYYGSWVLKRIRGGGRTTTVILEGQEGRYRCIKTIWCIEGFGHERTLISTDWTHGTAHYRGFRRLR